MKIGFEKLAWPSLLCGDDGIMNFALVIVIIKIQFRNGFAPTLELALFRRLDLTLDWLTTAIQRTRKVHRTLDSANLQESTTPAQYTVLDGLLMFSGWQVRVSQVSSQVGGIARAPVWEQTHS